ncbi:hypothetical protein AAVH_13410 [Aphelenchoides avenae]|nr:hypothetical protein AAVH_13410 [Aphelenchus avenae]
MKLVVTAIVAFLTSSLCRARRPYCGNVTNADTFEEEQLCEVYRNGRYSDGIRIKRRGQVHVSMIDGETQRLNLSVPAGHSLALIIKLRRVRSARTKGKAENATFIDKCVGEPSVGISFGMKYVVKLEWVAGVANDSDEVHVYHGDFNSTSNGTDKEPVFPMPQSKAGTLRSAHLFLHGNELSVIPTQSGTVESSAGGVFKMHSNVQSVMRKRFGRKRLLELIIAVPARYAGCFTVALERNIVLDMEVRAGPGYLRRLAHGGSEDYRSEPKM